MMDNNQQVQETTGLSKFYSKVYGYLGLGILLSAMTSYVMLNYFKAQVAQFLNGGSLYLLLLWGVQIGLVVYLGKNAFTNSGKTLVGYMVYTVLTGITLSLTLAMYTTGTIVLAFTTTAGMFIGMSLIGIFIKKDLTAMGHAMYSLLIGALIAIVLNVFFMKSSAVDLFISLAMVVIFSGLIAYDNQKIKKMYLQAGEQTASGLAVYCALTLYLDIVNLFIYLLRIFGRD